MPAFLEKKLKKEYPNNPGAVYWAAGIYEGEGSISSRACQIVQKDTWILFKLLTLFGGQVYKPGKDGVSMWCICGQIGRDFVESIYPLLSPRRQLQINELFVTTEKHLIRKKQNSDMAKERMTKWNAENKVVRNIKGQFIKPIKSIYAKIS